MSLLKKYNPSISPHQLNISIQPINSPIQDTTQITTRSRHSTHTSICLSTIISTLSLTRYRATTAEMLFASILFCLFAVIAQAAPATVKVAAAIDVNYACAVQPTGVGITPKTDTAAAFTAYSSFHGAAISAAYPAGYLISFAGATKAVQAQGYMTYYSLASYNPQTCANYCTNTYGCTSFNIFFERSPSLNPALGCASPPSVTYVKCSLFSQTVVSEQLATNAGQWRGPYSGNNLTQNFQVVLAGSNAYNRQ